MSLLSKGLPWIEVLYDDLCCDEETMQHWVIGYLSLYIKGSSYFYPWMLFTQKRTSWFQELSTMPITYMVDYYSRPITLIFLPECFCFVLV